MNTTACLLVAALAAVDGGALAAQTAGAVCTSVGLDPQRSWRFEPHGETWRVVHWRGSNEQQAVTLAMPANARARFTSDAVEFKARTSNGGIDVSLNGRAADARLDIYVSYELEVNVDTSLTPAIDELNTEGPIGVRCQVAAR